MLGDDATTIDVVNLFIGVLALLVASAAFGWRLFEWRRGGSIVKVEVHEGGVLPGDLPDGHRETITVAARNVGRTAVEIALWGVRTGATAFASRSTNAGFGQGPAMPHTLAPGHEARWQLPQEEFVEMCERAGDEPVLGFVELGTGRRVVSRRSITLGS